MKGNIKYIILCCLLWHTTLKAQPFQLKDVVNKDVELDTILNYSKSKTKLSAFTHKPLVIVFWHYTCGTCMGMFRWLDSLTDKHRQSVNFLLVTSADAAKVKELLKGNKYIGKMKMPFVVADKKLREWFPHYSVPHVVWIDGGKKVQAITEHGELNDANLAALAAGVLMQLSLKEEANDKNEFHSKDPMILYNFEKHRKGIMKYSLIVGQRKGISNHISMSYRDSFTRVNQTNTSVYELYKTAYDYTRKNGSLVEFTHKWKYQPDFNNGENVYCYDLLAKTTSLYEGLRHMQNDLDHYFRLRSRLEQRNVVCYLLQRMDTAVSIDVTELDEVNTTTLKNAPMYYLTEVLNRSLDKPVINETGISQLVTVYLPKHTKDVAVFKRYLQMQGFILAEAKRRQTVLIIE